MMMMVMIIDDDITVSLTKIILRKAVVPC